MKRSDVMYSLPRAMTTRVHSTLQRLREKVRNLQPWLVRAAGLTDYAIRPTGQGNFFTLTVTWEGGSHTFNYDAAMAKEAGGQCFRDHAHFLLSKILELRGV